MMTSRSGRHQTLRSIYGSATESSKAPKRPTSPPPSLSTGARPSHRKQRASDALRATEVHEDVRGDAECHEPSVAATNSNNSDSSERHETKRAVDQARAGRAGVPTVNAEAAAPMRHAPQRRPVDTSPVLSLYGDGFLEVRLKPESQLLIAPPSDDGLEGGRFAVELLVFKAADMAKASTIIECDKTRHEQPEIDDTGEFVRWTCCGSTNPSVYGCFVATQRANYGRGLPRIYTDAPTPKLLVAKLPSHELGRDVGFTIYDRGSSSKHDSGCRVWSGGLECWANCYEVPSNRWVRFTAAFDTRYLAIYVDDALVDCADVLVASAPSAPPASNRERVKRTDSQWIATVSAMSSVYIGGHPSYSRSVSEWRTRIGFVGLVGAFSLRAGPRDAVTASGAAVPSSLAFQTCEASVRASLGMPAQSRVTLVALRIPDVGKVRDASKFRQQVLCRRTLFWRREFPPLPDKSMAGMLLLGNFFHGGHHDLAVSSAKSFENLLLSVVQTADFRVVVDYALDADFRVGHEYGCRSQAEYEQKSLALVRGIEKMSPLLSVLVNEDKPPPIGSFEIRVELTRAMGRAPVAIGLHSMATSGCFPSESDVKKKIEAIVLFEAKRPQGEEIYTQAIRHFLALAERSRQNRERDFLESVINRKVVITERKIMALFQKLGFFFATLEAQEVVKYFRSVQDNYSRTRGRIEDLPTLSMLSPTSQGLYSLPFLKSLSLTSTLTVDGSAKQSPWQFVCVVLDHDFQLVDFVREECPIAHGEALSYRHSRYSFGGFVDRLHVSLGALQARVYCLLFSLTKRSGASSSAPVESASGAVNKEPQRVRVQFENSETRQVLGAFDALPTASCRWLTLGALYRAKKLGLWHVQALCHSGGANSLHGSVEDIHAVLCERQIVQTYEVRVYYATGASDVEEFASRFSENIRFGRNGCVVAVPVARFNTPLASSGVLAPTAGAEKQPEHTPLLRIALKLQRVDSEIDVYTHERQQHVLPTVQSIYRSLLGVLLAHGIKESVQQNPFLAQDRRIKRPVEIRVVGDRLNKPVEGAHVFIERNLEYGKLSASLAKKIVPTLTMGSRLVSIRRRLQKNRFEAEVRRAATALVTEALRLGSKVALLTLRRDSKLLPVVRSRALLRAAMRRRYERIRRDILLDVQQSEHSRVYSRSAPIRLRQLLATPLEWSSSERSLMQRFSRDGLRVLEDEMPVDAVVDRQSSSSGGDPSAVFAEWQAQKAHETDVEQADGPAAAEADAGHTEKSAAQPASGLPDRGGVNEVVSDAFRLHKKHVVTDRDGAARCSLLPGTYTVYVFHVEFFEWTSVAVVYPSTNPSGSYGGSAASPTTAQQLLVPLEEFRWAYSVQLVDFYQQHVPKCVAGIPLAITDKCGAHHAVATTDGAGRAAWDVQKGLYAVSAAPSCPCILYSALKNVVVDGSRLRASRTISVPVLFGKVKVDLAIVGVGIPAAATAASVVATVQLRKVAPQSQTQDAGAVESLEVESALQRVTPLQLRLGTYCLEASAPGCFTATATSVQVEWSAEETQARHLVVLTRAFAQPRTFRVVLALVAQAATSFSIALEIWKDKAAPAQLRHHVAVEHAERFHEWEYQSLVLSCQPGFSYKCLLGPSLHRFYPWRHCPPRVEVYSAAGCVFEKAFAPSAQPANALDVPVCCWDAHGDLLVPPDPRAK